MQLVSARSETRWKSLRLITASSQVCGPVKRLDGGGFIKETEKIELSCDVAEVVVGETLCLWAVDHSDGSLQSNAVAGHDLFHFWYAQIQCEVRRLSLQSQHTSLTPHITMHLMYCTFLTHT